MLDCSDVLEGLKKKLESMTLDERIKYLTDLGFAVEKAKKECKIQKQILEGANDPDDKKGTEKFQAVFKKAGFIAEHGETTNDQGKSL